MAQPLTEPVLHESPGFCEHPPLLGVGVGVGVAVGVGVGVFEAEGAGVALADVEGVAVGDPETDGFAVVDEALKDVAFVEGSWDASSSTLAAVLAFTSIRLVSPFGTTKPLSAAHVAERVSAFDSIFSSVIVASSAPAVATAPPIWESRAAFATG